VSRLTRFAWQRLPDGTFALPARRDLRLEIAPNTLGHYEIRERPLDAPARKLAEFGDLAAAFRGADGTVSRRFQERVRLLDKTARWRREPATEKQLDVLRAPDMARDLARFLGIRDLPKALRKGRSRSLSIASKRSASSDGCEPAAARSIALFGAHLLTVRYVEAWREATT
jgi:hypothetical protein